jgi:putative FmdB family regulatory protein
MPVYEYECIHCGHRFELKQSFHDKPQAACPQCKKPAKRVFHPALVIFKGSGFYVTDHRKSGDAAASKADPGSHKEKSETKKSKD